MHVEDRNKATDSGVVDLSELKDNVGGRMTVVDKLVEHIREALPQSLAQLRRAVNAEDPEEVRRQAHALKSPLGNFGAEKAFRLARELELRAAAGDMSRSLALLVTLESEVRRILDFFADPDWRDRV